MNGIKVNVYYTAKITDKILNVELKFRNDNSLLLFLLLHPAANVEEDDEQDEKEDSSHHHTRYKRDVCTWETKLIGVFLQLFREIRF